MHLILICISCTGLTKKVDPGFQEFLTPFLPTTSAWPCLQNSRNLWPTVLAIPVHSENAIQIPPKCI